MPDLIYKWHMLGDFGQAAIVLFFLIYCVALLVMAARIGGGSKR